jgi:hypothetical protein
MIEGAAMYTGKLISELMATVDRVGQETAQQRMAHERDLHAIFAMQIPVTPADRVFVERIFMGAA